MLTFKQFCTFHLNDLFFGVEVLKVQEVIRYQSMTCVPLAHPMIRGLINLRGQIVTAIDLRRRLEFPKRQGGELPTNVVVRTDDGAVSLLVDEIGDVLDVELSSFEKPPETLRGVARDLVQGVYKLDDQLMLHLNVENVINLVPAEVKAA